MDVALSGDVRNPRPERTHQGELRQRAVRLTLKLEHSTQVEDSGQRAGAIRPGGYAPVELRQRAVRLTLKLEHSTQVEVADGERRVHPERGAQDCLSLLLFQGQTD